MSQPVVGVVGLGLVGTALTARLRAAGFDVLGFDIRPQARTAFGPRAAASLRGIGERCGCVVLAVFESKDVVEVLESPEGLLSGAAVRSVIDCSTGDPQILESLAARLAPRGIDFIEAPLSGSSEQIGAGKATMLLGGNAEAITANANVLEALSPQRLHMGSAGAGAKAKLATNLVLGLNRAALAEGMVFAGTMGIAPEQFLALVLATPATSGAAEAKGRMMVEENFEPQSRIRQHLKDVTLMLDQAKQAGMQLPLSEAHAQLMRDAVAAGDGDLDNAAIIRTLRNRKPFFTH